MANSSTLDEVAAQFDAEQGVVQGNWFGKPCLKAGGKVFVTQWKGDLAFKLEGKAHAEALAVAGARLFDPQGKGHPMKAWVQVPAAQLARWPRFAEMAYKWAVEAAEMRKEQLIADLVDTRSKLLAAATSLPALQQDQVFLGVWSVKDLLAHLVGWDYANLEAVKAILASRLPAFYAHYDRDWRNFNARLVAEHKRDDPSELCEAARASHRQLVEYVRTVPAEAFDEDRGVRFKGYKVTIRRTLQTEAEDEKVHLDQITSFAAS